MGSFPRNFASDSNANFLWIFVSNGTAISLVFESDKKGRGAILDAPGEFRRGACISNTGNSNIGGHMKILIFDNYDSFTYNLVHLVEKITHEKTDVYRNDKIPLEKVKEYDKIILSPGPGTKMG